jgi:hypothetical protein
MNALFRTSCAILPLVGALLATSDTARAVTFSFTSNPFAGTDALTTPGRQIVAGEPSITFNIASDVFSFDPVVFGISGILFANDVAGNLPASGVNTIVLRTFGDPFVAGTAANLIADQITSPGPGFFIYFNSNLDLPRLVYSTDLSVNTSDLAVLARITNLSGQSGRDALATFTAANFQVSTNVPEPASNLIYVIAAGALVAARYAFRRGAPRD